ARVIRAADLGRSPAAREGPRERVGSQDRAAGTVGLGTAVTAPERIEVVTADDEQAAEARRDALREPVQNAPPTTKPLAAGATQADRERGRSNLHSTRPTAAAAPPVTQRA